MKIVEKAKVVSAEGRLASVEISTPAGQSACGRCPHAGSCGPSGTSRILKVELSYPLKPGDEVILELELPSPVLAAVVLFLLPLVCAFGAAVAILGLTGSGIWALIAGAGGMAAAYMGVFAVGGRSAAKARILGPATAAGPSPTSQSRDRA